MAGDLFAPEQQAVAAKKSDEAEEQRKEVMKKKEQGNEAFKSGRVPAAIKAYSEAIELDFHCGNDEKLTAVLYSNRAAAHLKQAEKRDGSGREWSWAEAERDCRRSLQRDPHAVKVLLRCALACEKLAQPSDAFELLARALLVEPANSTARESVTRLRAEYVPAESVPAEGVQDEQVEQVDLSDADVANESGAAPPAHPLTVSSRTAKYIRSRRDNRVERGNEKQAQAYTEAMALLGIAEEKPAELSAEQQQELENDRLEYYVRMTKAHNTDIVRHNQPGELSRESERAREWQRKNAEEKVKELQRKAA